MLLLSLLIFLVLNSGNDSDALRAIQDQPSPLSPAVASTRSTFAIVWSCTTTTFLCAWVCIHLDLYTFQGANDSMKRLRYSLLHLSLAIISPEFIVGWAIKQRLNAAEIIREYKGWTMTHAHVLDMGGFALYFPETTRKQPRGSSEAVWEHQDQQGTSVDEDVIPPRFIEILDFERFKTFLDEGSIDFPTITKDEIDDRSKSDGLSKFLAGVQTCWFILQCIVRKTQSLATTELEVTTFALATLNVITLFLWRSKPQNMRIPIPVYLVEGSKEWDNWKEKYAGEGAQSWTEDCGRTAIDNRNQRTWRTEAFLKTQQYKLNEAKNDSNVGQRLITLLGRLLSGVDSASLGFRFMAEWYVMPETGRKRKEGLLLKVTRRLLDLLLAVCTLPAIRPPLGAGDPQTLLKHDLEQHLGVWTTISCKDIHPQLFYQFLLNLPDFVLIPSNFLRHKWVQLKSTRGMPTVFLHSFLCVCVIILLSPFVVYFALNVIFVLITPVSFLFLQSTRFCTFIDLYFISSVSVSDPNKIRIHRKSKILGVEEAHFAIALVIGSLFGGLHCVGWSFSYATLSEQWIWRAAALALAVTPSLYFLVLTPYADPRPFSPFICIVYLNRVVLLILLYAVARVTIIVLAVKLLWAQPESAYLAINWTQIFPHVA